MQVKKNRIELKNCYKTSAIDEQDQLKHIVFNNHRELKDKFLFKLFGDNTRFYFNKTIDETKTCLYDNKGVIPAIIGIG